MPLETYSCPVSVLIPPGGIISAPARADGRETEERNLSERVTGR